MSENLKVYTVEDLTEMLGTSKNAVYCLLKKNYFRSIKIGGLYRIPKKGFDDWLEGKPEDGAQEVFETEVEDRTGNRISTRTSRRTSSESSSSLSRRRTSTR